MIKIQATSSPQNIWPEVGPKNSRQKGKQHWVKEKPKLDNARKLRGIHSFDLEDMDFKETMNMRESSLN